MKSKSKDEQVDDEKPIADGDESDARQARDQRRERRIDGDHTEQRAGEQPLEMFHTAGNAHLVTDGAQNVIGEKNAKDIKP